ncbi:M48 family metallopeptidase [Alicyclobacillus kakegawensis]|uniref:M48 family metallopeptidase n=1 Tax=Alicyclobacillus kakegawensis TaxID=392012 RepID=UPI000835E4B5|nr:SprT family zinc-dependent metalloprotease [Alicyclobacillus kakegawensis]
MPEFRFDDRIVQYVIEHRPRKTKVTLHVDGERGVYIRAPLSVPDAQDESMVARKAEWIVRKMDEIENKLKSVEPHRFEPGEMFWYLGEKYPLHVIHVSEGKPPELHWNAQSFSLYTPLPARTGVRDLEPVADTAALRRLFRDWYMKAGRPVIEERVETFAPVYGWPKRIILKEQKSRWGSCSSDGTIRLNWHILMAPMAIIDYLIVHELAHLRHRNHARPFWDAVARTIPDYPERRRWLRDNGHRFKL